MLLSRNKLTAVLGSRSSILPSVSTALTKYCQIVLHVVIVYAVLMECLSTLCIQCDIPQPGGAWPMCNFRLVSMWLISRADVT